MRWFIPAAAASDVSFAPVTDNPATDVQTAIENNTTAIESNTTAIASAVAQLGLAFIESQDASASATLDFTGFDATKYDAYVFVLSNIIPATDASVLRVRTSSDGGTSYDSGASDYAFAVEYLTFATSPVRSEFGDDAAAAIDVTENIGATAGEDGASITLRINGPHLAKETHLDWSGVLTGSSLATRERISGGGVRLSSEDVDAVQFLMSAGNIASGTITMYGLRNQ